MKEKMVATIDTDLIKKLRSRKAKTGVPLSYDVNRILRKELGGKK